MKITLNPTYKLPEFYAVDLSRLPPVDFTHCDISAIMIELQGLRREVRDLKHITEEVSNLRQQVTEISGLREEFEILKQFVVEMRELPTTKQELLPGHSVVDGVTKVPVLESGIMSTSFAAVVNRLKPNEFNESRPKKYVAPVVGNGDGKHHIQTVLTKRSVDIFVSRLHPATDMEHLRACVNDILPELPAENIECVKLHCKYEHLYSSFHVCVRVDAVAMKEAIDKLMAPKSWPVGLLVRRYFRAKTKNGERA
jgi:hypothetical protein